MAGTEIIRCTCSHPFQDGVYGKSNRVANTMRSGQLKCTVCGTISGSKGIVPSGKAAKATDVEPVVEKAKKGQKVTKSLKAPMKGGDKDNRGRTKEKQSSKGKTVKTKPKAQDKSKKMNKK